MKDFFVPKDLLLFSNNMGMNSDFSVRGFSGGLSEAMGTLTVTVSAADTYWSDVALLVQPPAGASDGYATVSDLSTDARTLTKYGNVQVATLSGKKLWLFDGSGDYVTCPYAIDFDFTANGTLDIFMSPVAIKATTQYVVSKRWFSGISGGNRGWGVTISNTGFLAFFSFSSSGVNTYIQTPTSISAGTLIHVEVTRESGVYKMYVNGAYIGQMTVTPGTASAPLYLGWTNPVNSGTSYNGQEFSGHMAVRFTPGVVRHSADFTPPAYPLPTS